MRAFLVLCSVCCLVSGAIGQDWTGPYLLSDSLGGIKPATCKEWLPGSVTCLVWQFFDGRNWDVISKFCSFQNGNGWGPAIWVSGPAEAANPAVACFNDGVSGVPSFYCVWEHRGASRGDIYAAFDTVGGQWSSRGVIGTCINTDGDSSWPQVMVIRSGSLYDTAWITWTNHDTSGSYIECAYNAGDSWTTPMIAVAQANPIRHTRLGRGFHGRYNGCPLLTWESNGDIFYTEYLDGSWQVPQEVAHSAAPDRNPDVVSYTNVPFPLGPWITWESCRDGDTAVCGTAADTFSIGRRWCDSTGAGNNYAPCGTPAAYTMDYWEPAAAAWVTDRNGNPDIYSRTLFSDDDGYVDRDTADDVNPTMTTIGLTEHWCIWQSNRSGNWDIWGSYMYATGVEESRKPQTLSFKPEQTVVRGVLFLEGDCPRTGTVPKALLDISGRKMLDLHLGANDVGGVVPGVYFVRDAQAQAQAQAMRKVVIQR
ncbi:MAG: hypothetical protein NTX53_14010 [candidate division WOR-3 bacterium]|nr:hypothetical protein [candidate division WOR-3 bacterium]